MGGVDWDSSSDEEESAGGCCSNSDGVPAAVVPHMLSRSIIAFSTLCRELSKGITPNEGLALLSAVSVCCSILLINNSRCNRGLSPDVFPMVVILSSIFTLHIIGTRTCFSAVVPSMNADTEISRDSCHGCGPYGWFYESTEKVKNSCRLTGATVSSAAIFSVVGIAAPVASEIRFWLIVPIVFGQLLLHAYDAPELKGVLCNYDIIQPALWPEERRGSDGYHRFFALNPGIQALLTGSVFHLPIMLLNIVFSLTIISTDEKKVDRVASELFDEIIGQPVYVMVMEAVLLVLLSRELYRCLSARYAESYGSSGDDGIPNGSTNGSAAGLEMVLVSRGMQL